MVHDCVGRQKYEKNVYFYGKMPGFYMQDTVYHTLDSTQASAMVLTPPSMLTVTSHPSEPPRHDGLLRPVSTISETFVFSLLLVLLFLLHKVVKTGPAVIWEMVKNLLFHDDRGFTRETMVKRNTLFLWPVNVFFVTMGANVFLQIFNVDAPTDTWLFWKLGLFTLLFLIAKNLLYKLVAMVYFAPDLTRRWIQGNQIILTVFSMTLVPLLLLHEMNVVLPFWLLYAWPAFFLILPRIVYAFKGLNFFLLEHGGIVYIILYLCALEILPLLVFFKGIFLIQ
jgi:hypothetical protein